MIWQAENLAEAINNLRRETRGLYKPGARVAVKLHMGEKGGKYYLDPEIAKQIVTVLQSHGYRPFLFDTPAMYSGGRNTVKKYYQTAASHGYTEEKIGCPIVISDESIPVPVAGFTYGVAKDIAQSDGLFVLSHVKGHECTGVGGAIKNLGMGAVDKKTKRAMHTLAKPQLVGECSNCKTCERVCPDKSITILGRRVKIKGVCYGCNICVSNCPNQALAPKDRRIEVFIAQAAAAVVRSVPKVYGANVLQKITNHCDCYTGELPIVASDLGFIGGSDLVALDNAAIDKIDQKAGKKVFEELYHKSPKIQLVEAQRLEIGKASNQT